jgi:hypothetical protein
MRSPVVVRFQLAFNTTGNRNASRKESVSGTQTTPYVLGISRTQKGPETGGDVDTRLTGSVRCASHAVAGQLPRVRLSR